MQTYKLTVNGQTSGQMGFPGFFAYISGTMETVGGALLIIGLGSRLAAAFLTLEMAIAFLRVDFAFRPFARSPQL